MEHRYQLWAAACFHMDVAYDAARCLVCLACCIDVPAEYCFHFLMLR